MRRRTHDGCGGEKGSDTFWRKPADGERAQPGALERHPVAEERRRSWGRRGSSRSRRGHPRDFQAAAPEILCGRAEYGRLSVLPSTPMGADLAEFFFEGNYAEVCIAALEVFENCAASKG